VQYSPLPYILYSIPGQIITLENPFVGPRVIVIAAFVGCIAIATSIIGTLIPIRFVWVWGPLLAVSISVMAPWVLQIRADFLGICFGLLAIRLLLSQSRWSVPLAGIVAGLALQFKITFVAAAAAGALWLLIYRRWADAVRFIGLSAAFSAGLYFLYSIREPRMLSQMLALSPGILDLKGNLRLVYQVLSEPIMLLALAGLPKHMQRINGRWILMLIFAATSFLVAAVTDLQAGGNINYYFEGLFAVIPMAALGVVRLEALARRYPALGVFVVGLFGLHFVMPKVVDVHRNPFTAGTVESRNAQFRSLQQAVQGHHIFSAVPRIALLDPNPQLTEPYLLSYRLRLGRPDTTMLPEKIRRMEYEGIITYAESQQWRGVVVINPDLHKAIAESYKPHCTISGMLLHVPRYSDTAASPLVQNLLRIGCVPLSDSQPPNW
jgi:hypothetical protein